MNGLTLEWKKRLLRSAIASKEDEAADLYYYNLGGDLPNSAWGDPESARETFRWLSRHPWVQRIDPVYQQTRRTRQIELASADTQLLENAQILTPASQLSRALLEAPENRLAEAAWQVYVSLYAPVYPLQHGLPELRSNSLGQVWSLLQAADWAESPGRRNDCRGDPDHDGQAECVLASETAYAQFEIDDGSLTFLFVNSGGDPNAGESLHQLIGPGSQLITGLSDAATWDLSAGHITDPQVIPGAFAGPGRDFAVGQDEGILAFTRPEDDSVKVFHLTPHGIEVRYDLPPDLPNYAVRIPLLLDPWRRFYPGWPEKYPTSQAWADFRWPLDNGQKVQVRTNSTLQGFSFLDSQVYFSDLEDPNRDYPFGHQLPFPLSLMEVKAAEQLFVAVELLSSP